MKFKAFALLLLTPILFSGCKATDQQIQSWIEKNPDKILQVLMEHQKKQQEAGQPKDEDVKQNSAALFNNSSSPTLGNGPIKIAYFFDFNCGHCIKQSETIKNLMAKTDKVQIIFKNFAVLGPSSELTARAALAAHQQNKYYEFYTEALKTREKNPETLKAIAQKLKLDVTKWQTDFESEAVKKELAHVSELAGKMKLSGTPAIAISPDKIYAGRVDQLAEIIESIK